MGLIPPSSPLYSLGQLLPIVWKSWFAWHPVKVKGKWQWMRKVYRYRPQSIFARHSRWEYGDLFDVLTSNTGPAGQKPLPPSGRILNH